MPTQNPLLRYLFYLEVAIAALGAALAVCIGVTALIYAFYLHDEEVREGFVSLLILTGVFAVLGSVTGVAAWALYQHKTWWKAAQAALLLALPPLLVLVYVNIAR
jgi:Ca2+/Na+ antiporter